MTWLLELLSRAALEGVPWSRRTEAPRSRILWELGDLGNNPITYLDGKKANSLKSHNEYDCKEERWRGIYVVPFTGNMASGSPVNSTDGERN